MEHFNRILFHKSKDLLTSNIFIINQSINEPSVQYKVKILIPANGIEVFFDQIFVVFIVAWIKYIEIVYGWRKRWNEIYFNMDGVKIPILANCVKVFSDKNLFWSS